MPKKVTTILGTEQEGERSLIRTWSNAEQELPADRGLGENEKTVLRSWISIEQQLRENEESLRRSKSESEQNDTDKTLIRPFAQGGRRPAVNIGAVEPENAKTYAFLDILQNGQTVQGIAITEENVIIGRTDPQQGIKPQIDLSKFDAGGTTSRQHARIRLEDSHFTIEDLKSRNKTKVGDVTLTPNSPLVLQNGDVISIGSVKATFRLLGTSKLPVSWAQS